MALKARKPPVKRGPNGGARPGAGRPRGAVSQIKLDLKTKAQEYAGVALATLAEIAKDKKAPHAARVSASNSLLDRGYGKAIQFVDAHVETVGNVGVYKVTRTEADKLQMAERGVTFAPDPDPEDYDTSEEVPEAF